MKEPIRILLVDDHAFVRRAVKRLLEVDPSLVVCGEAETSDQTMQAIRRSHPDVVIMDLALKHDDGLTLTRAIRARYAHLPVLILTLHKETLFAETALRAGASGYLMKNDAPQYLIEAVREVVRDRIYVSEGIRQGIFARMRGEQLARTHGRPHGPRSPLGIHDPLALQLAPPHRMRHAGPTAQNS